MRFVGDKKLSKWFILVLFGWAVFVGEIVPVWVQTMEGVSADEVGAKESMFASWDMFIPTVVLYTLIAVVFLFLYRRLHWLWVLLLAATLGTILEFALFRPQETSGPDVVQNPLGALFFFIIIWPILLGVPYALFRWLVGRVSPTGVRPRRRS